MLILIVIILAIEIFTGPLLFLYQSSLMHAFNMEPIFPDILSDF